MKIAVFKQVSLEISNSAPLLNIEKEAESDFHENETNELISIENIKNLHSNEKVRLSPRSLRAAKMLVRHRSRNREY